MKMVNLQLRERHGAPHDLHWYRSEEFAIANALPLDRARVLCDAGFGAFQLVPTMNFCPCTSGSGKWSESRNKSRLGAEPVSARTACAVGDETKNARDGKDPNDDRGD